VNIEQKKINKKIMYLWLHNYAQMV